MPHEEFGDLACDIDSCGENVGKKLPSYRGELFKVFAHSQASWLKRSYICSHSDTRRCSVKRRYPVKTILFISLLTSINYSANLNYRLVDPSIDCQFKKPIVGNAVSVTDISQFSGRGALQNLDLEEYKWMAVPHGFYNPVAFDFGDMAFAGEFIETSQGMLSRLVGNPGGYYYVFDSPEGKVLIMSGMLDCSD